MVFTHVENERDVLHINYYESALGKEGSVDFTLADPRDCSKLHVDDTIAIDGLHNCNPGEAVTITLTHADGTSEEIQALHA